jgi:hypothetical protein
MRVRDASPLLGTLGFAKSEPTIPEWFDALELVKDVPTYPLVPAEWFRDNPRQIAEGYIQLDKVTREYRQNRESLPEFTEHAIVQIEPDVFQTWCRIPENGDSTLLPHEHFTVVTLCSYLKNIIVLVRQLVDSAKTTDEALNQALTVLGLKPRRFSARGIGKVEEILGQVVTVAPILRSWLDPEKRGLLADLLNQLPSRLPEFSGKALFLDSTIDDPRPLADLIENDSPNLRPHASPTILKLRNHLDAGLKLLQELRGLFSELESALQAALDVLRLDRHPLTVRGLRKVQEILALLSAPLNLRRSWLESAKRQEIQEVLGRIGDNQEQNTRARLKILERSKRPE